MPAHDRAVRPSKTFNLAGLVGSYHIIYNKTLRDRGRPQRKTHNEMNVLSMHALLGAYPEGRAWVDELCAVLTENVDYACRSIAEHSRVCAWPSPKGHTCCFGLHRLVRRPRQDHRRGGTGRLGRRRGWQDGRMFHGPCAIRVNLALPKSLVVEAFERLDKYVFNA